ncbi:MAG: aconitate hydratase [Sphaerochaetaceae bacterium]|nr:aconitate hydratase [Sphaerochaetaceae bacterium]
MGQNVTYKILSEHLEKGSLEKGNPVSIRIDQTLTQDATGTMAYLQFEALGLPRVQNELAVSYVDHNTVQVGFENADDHAYLKSVAERYHIVFSRPGNGICHQVHLERFGAPGKTLLGSDSHTPTGGGLSMIAIGAGGLDIAVAMAGQPFQIISPKVVGIKLTGTLRNFVSAKDVILTVLEHYGVKGNVNTVFEYFGEGVKNLSVPERATICNMGAEAGVTTSLFPSDFLTEEFLIKHGRGDLYRELSSDGEDTYDEVFEIDLARITPKTAAPHSPGNVVPVHDVEGMKVDQVLIGSCTNSSYQDMRRVADILKGHTVHPDVSLGIAPGSREVLMMLSQDGSLATFIASGARILESACGFCIGNHQSPGSNAVSLRTNNRNFEGRSGTKSAQVYLVSPETAALSAIAGSFVDPLGDHGIPYPPKGGLSEFIVDDEMFIFPPEDGSGIQVQRGPNIGEPPTGSPIKDTISGEVTLKVTDKITTDHIMPAGQRLKFRSNIPEYAKYTFEPVDPTFHDRCQANQKEGKANIIIAGASYGQGSSREHAAICPMYLGIEAIISKGFERIHHTNLCNFGILPLEFQDEGDYDSIDQGDELVIESVAEHLERYRSEGIVFTVRNVSKGTTFSAVARLTPTQIAYLKSGGLLEYMKG